MSVIYPRVRYNRLRRIIATFDIFDTNPTDPANMTDEDWTTETGEGIETVTVATGLNRTVGNIIFDMGAICAVTIFALVNMHRASGDGNIGLSIDFSSDASTSKVNSLEADLSRLRQEVEALKAENVRFKENAISKEEYEEFMNRLIDSLKGLLPETPKEGNV